MCLNPGFAIPKQKSGTGYKVFKITNTGLWPMTEYGKNRIYKQRLWLNEKSFRRSPNYEGRPEEGYGFHIWLSIEDAKAASASEESVTVVRKVKYRKATALGEGIWWPADISHGKTVVAKEIYIYKTDIK